MTTPLLKYKEGRYYLRFPQNRGSEAREAGFQWSSHFKVWFTTDPIVADKMRNYAESNTLVRLEGMFNQYDLSAKVSEEGLQYPVPEGLDYFNYQKVGIKWAIQNKRCLIGDEMGLGKTVQAIGLVNALPNEIKHVLVICPASLKYNWEKEFTKWSVQSHDIQVVNGRKADIDPLCNIVIVNYDLLIYEEIHRQLLKLKWDVAIIDEAHYLQSATAQRSARVLGGAIGKGDNRRIVQGITENIERVVTLSGTPTTGKPINLYYLLSRLAPQVISPHNTRFAFGKKFCAGYNTGFGWNFEGRSNLDELNRRLRSGFMIRRKKADVLKELPPKTYKMIPLDVKKLQIADNSKLVETLDMSKLTDADSFSKDADLAEALRQTLNADEDTPVLEMLSQARNVLGEEKAKQAIAYAKDVMSDTDGKVVIFAHHKAIVAQLQQALKEYGVVVVNGDVPAKKRQEHVEAFQTNPEVRVFVGNLQAAGVGLTLTESPDAIFVETNWNAGDIEQAVDRVHRIGQKKPVTAHFLVARGTFEEYIMASIIHKAQTMQNILDHNVQDTV